MGTRMNDTQKKIGISGLRIVGILGLLAAVTGSLVLVLVALGFIEQLPGCGPNSGCDKVTAGAWGRIPLIEWPVSFVGFAYFSGLLVAWILAAPGWGIRTLMRLGMLASIMFVVVMITEGAFCRWCATAHAGNLIAWICCELIVRRQPANGPRGLTKRVYYGSASVFMGLTILLAIILPLRRDMIESRNAKDLATNQEEIMRGTSDASTLSRLDSRNVLGPKDAKVKVVMFTDYQCPDCKRFEAQAENILRQRDDVSFAIKYYPFCPDCNPNVKANRHPNACWAARAAEAARMLQGEAGLERMHNWLFKNSGSFTQASFSASLKQLGFDPTNFIKIMNSPQTLAAVKADAVDGFELGIYFTPMIFINGVEYKWYLGSGGTMAKTIDMAARRDDTEQVVPPSRMERLFIDWKTGRSKRFRGVIDSSWTGDGPIEVVIYGDYQHATTLTAEALIQELMSDGQPLKFTFRHTPFETKGDLWNYDVSLNMAKAVEASRILGGDEARWKAHDWAIRSSGNLSSMTIATEVAAETGLEVGAVRAMMDSAEVKKRLDLDDTDKKRTWKATYPSIVIDNRHVMRWNGTGIDSKALLLKIIDDAKASKARRTHGNG
jgi:protein-disulfide isomerase/uncharacterized membrane protein